MKLKQTIILALVIALALIGGGLFIGRSVKHTLQANLVDNYSKEETTIGEQVAGTLQSKIQNVENSLNVLALDPNIQSSNPAVCNNSLQQAITNTNLGIGNLGRVNSQGVFYCSVNKALIGLPASKLGTYVQQLIDDPQHNVVMSKMIKVPGVTGYAVAIHAPVYDTNHKFIGTIGGAFYLDQLASSYLDKVKFAQTGFVGLQDENGDIIYSHTKNRIGQNYFSPAIQNQNAELKNLNVGIRDAYTGKQSIVRYTNASKVHKIASVVPVTIAPNHRWVIVVNVPVSEISAIFLHTGLNRAFQILTAIYCGSVLLIAFLMILSIVRDDKLKKAEDQFISLVSHQLRTPLTSIRLFSEMLDKGQVGKMTPKQEDYISKIHISTIRMINLVGDILNVSRLGLNRLKIVPVPTNIDALTQSYVDEVSSLAAEREVDLNYHKPEQAVPEVNIDPILLGQILHNLLTNAIRYSKSPGGVVDVSILMTGKGYEISVTDNGIGIPKKAQRHIFDRFYRASNAVSAVGEGTGLGLYLVKLITEASNCKISFTSKQDSGTTFRVTIPRSGMRAKKGESKLDSVQQKKA